MPECGLVTMTSPSCTFQDVKSQQRALVTLTDPTATVLNTLDTTMRDVPYGGNSLRRLLEATFPAKPSKPSSYLAAPKASFTVTPSDGGAAVSGTAWLIPSREKSVKARGPTRDRQYVVKALERRPGNDDVSRIPAGQCTKVIRAPCSQGCPKGKADFGDGCVAVCPPGQVDAGSGCATLAADTCSDCITAFDNYRTSLKCPKSTFTDLNSNTCVSSCLAGTFVNSRTCVACCPQGTPASSNICPCGFGFRV